MIEDSPILFPYFFGSRKQHTPKSPKTIIGAKRFFLLKYSISNRYGMNDSKNPIIDGRATGHSGADSHFMFYRISI